MFKLSQSKNSQFRRKTDTKFRSMREISTQIQNNTPKWKPNLQVWENTLGQTSQNNITLKLKFCSRNQKLYHYSSATKTRFPLQTKLMLRQTTNFQQLLEANPRGYHFIKANIIVKHAFDKALKENKLQYLYKTTYDRLFFTPALQNLLENVDSPKKSNINYNTEFKRLPTPEAVYGLYLFVDKYEKFLEDKFFVTSLLSFDNPPRELFVEAVFAIAEVLQNVEEMKKWISDFKDTLINEGDYKHMMYFLGKEAIQPRDVVQKSRPSFLLTKTMTMSRSSFLVASTTSIMSEMQYVDDSKVSGQELKIDEESKQDVFSHKIKLTKQEKQTEITPILALVSVALIGFGLNTNPHSATNYTFLAPLLSGVAYFFTLLVFVKSPGKPQLIFSSLFAFASQLIGYLGLILKQPILATVYSTIYQLPLSCILCTLQQIQFTTLGASQVYYVEITGVFLAGFFGAKLFKNFQEILALVGFIAFTTGIIILVFMPQMFHLQKLENEHQKQQKKLQMMHNSDKLAASCANLYNDIDKNLQIPRFEKYRFIDLLKAFLQEQKIIVSMLVFVGASVSFNEFEPTDVSNLSEQIGSISIIVVIITGLICSHMIRVNKLFQTIFGAQMLCLSIAQIVLVLLNYLNESIAITNVNSSIILLLAASTILPQIASISEILTRYQNCIIALGIVVLFSTVVQIAYAFIDSKIRVMLQGLFAVCASSLIIAYLNPKEAQSQQVI